MDSTISTVHNFLQALALPPGARILAAVSGGADSIAMLHLLSRISDLKFQILCAHINHHLRADESDADERFTADLCRQWNIPFFVEHIDVKTFAAQNKLSIETAARRLRIDALIRIARAGNCRYIAAAHHKDDQAETLLFRLLRGTSFPGLTGIRPIITRDGLQWIRPMLDCRRADIESYCRRNNIAWRTDASNLQTHYRRNWIRHRLLPAMQADSTKDLTASLAALAHSALQLQRSVESSAAKILNRILNRDSHLFPETPHTVIPNAGEEAAEFSHDEVVSLSFRRRPESSFQISASIVRDSGPFVAGEILRTALEHLGCGLRDITVSHYRRFFDLLDKSRASLQLPAGCTVRKKADLLTFENTSHLESKIQNLKSKIHLPLKGTTTFGPWLIQTRILNRDSHLFPDIPTAAASDHESQSKIQNLKSKIPLRQYFDLAQLHQPLTVRPRKSGDAFIPFGRKTPKKLARFLIDAKTPADQKHLCFVMEDDTDILWLAPLRRSASAPITDNTTDILEITLTPAG